MYLTSSQSGVAGQIAGFADLRGRNAYIVVEIETMESGSSTASFSAYTDSSKLQLIATAGPWSIPAALQAGQIGFSLPNNYWSGLIVDNFKVTQTLVAEKPIFSPSGKYISGPTAITVLSGTTDASIYYTLDGSTPTLESLFYQEPVMVHDGETLKAIAFGNGYGSSAVTSETFVVPAAVASGSANVDGNLSDWADADWISLDQDYNGSATDVVEASFAARWRVNKMYVAVKVRDTGHYFKTAYTHWAARDAVEVYLHTDSTGDITYDKFKTAQQYVVGFTGANSTELWSAMGGNSIAYPYAGNTFGGTFSRAAGSIDGEWLYYEFELTPFTFLDSYLAGDLSTSLITQLMPGKIIGLDVCVVGHDGLLYTGMKSENLMKGKSGNWEQFQRYLISGDQPIAGDANEDKSVDVGDLGILAANYGTAFGATWDKGDFNGDGTVDVGDLGILAANYGRGSHSSMSWEAAYAKAFGTTAVEEDSEEESMNEIGSSLCSGLGLPLVAGLALMGLMLVRLEE
jgi:hypothetical protein